MKPYPAFHPNSLLLGFILLVATVVAPAFAAAQKYACVNTEYVTTNVPDYVNAQKRVLKFAEEWQQELDEKFAELDNLRKSYQQEAYLLPDNLRQRRQEELKTKEQEVRALQRQRFGTGGDLDRKREEFLKPVQDRIYSAIERIANEKNYAFVFDKSASSTLIFANEKYDISDQVLELLGCKPGDAAAAAAKENAQSGKNNIKGPTDNKEMNYR